MSLETVVEDIRKEADARAEEIRQDAESRAEEIVNEAEADAEETVAEAERAVEREVDQREEQRLSSAKLEAKQERLEARRDVLGEVREAVEAEIAALSGGTREELTRALLEAAEPEFADAADVVVHGRADDHALLADLLAGYDGWSVGDEHDCLGGVVVESEAGRIRVNNTFDSVLADVWEDELKEISDRLFEQ